MRDSATFGEFYGATAPKVVAQVYAMIGNLPEAEDAVQEAYARAWSRWQRVGAYADPMGWVRTVAYRIAVSNWRRSRTRLMAHLRAQATQPTPALSADTVALVTALRQIAPSQRRAIVLHHLAGLSVREIAEETGSSQSAVKAQLSRGRQALAPLLSVEELAEVDRHA
jgi:RNA polymerase sigma-70 factor (ECF subfamily)